MKKILSGLVLLMAMGICIPSASASVDNEMIVYISELSNLLDVQKKNKGTYLGVVSSKKGAEKVREINGLGGNPIVIATSKDAYCMMKGLPSGTNYCVSSGGFRGVADGCSKNNISCLSSVKNDREKIISMIKKLLAKKNEDGWQVARLLSATKKGDLQEIKQLIAEGANVNGENSGEVPLLLGAGVNLDVVNELIRAGADVNWEDDYGYKVMYYSANIDIMKTLVKAGTDYKGDVSIRTVGESKKMPFLSVMLLNEIFDNDVETVKELILLGADVNATMYDEEGKEYKNAPMTIADIEGYKEISAELKKAGAKINGEGPEWVKYRTRRDYAISMGGRYKLTR
jgi:hypothetical protein